MAKLIISTNMTLDGIVEDPDGWFAGRNLEAWATIMAEEARRTTALLLGARSDAWFAERWLARDGAWADRLNALPKYVVSSSAPSWSNATRVDVDAVAGLKHELDGDLVVYGSAQLARTLLERDLVDELRLFVFPVVLGAGARLFGETRTPLRLVAAQTVGEGLVLVTYERAS